MSGNGTKEKEGGSYFNTITEAHECMHIAEVELSELSKGTRGNMISGVFPSRNLSKSRRSE